MARLKRDVTSNDIEWQPPDGLPIGFAMARLKRSTYWETFRWLGQPWLTDRIRDGAIETRYQSESLSYLLLRARLPIGFAMARLKL